MEIESERSARAEQEKVAPPHLGEGLGNAAEVRATRTAMPSQSLNDNRRSLAWISIPNP